MNELSLRKFLPPPRKPISTARGDTVGPGVGTRPCPSPGQRTASAGEGWHHQGRADIQVCRAARARVERRQPPRFTLGDRLGHPSFHLRPKVYLKCAFSGGLGWTSPRQESPGGVRKQPQIPAPELLIQKPSWVGSGSCAQQAPGGADSAGSRTAPPETLPRPLTLHWAHVKSCWHSCS